MYSEARTAETSIHEPDGERFMLARIGIDIISTDRKHSILSVCIPLVP